MDKKTRFHFLFLFLAVIVLAVGCSKASHKIAVENQRKNVITAEPANRRKADVSLPEIQSVELFTFKAEPISFLGKSFTESPKSGNSNSQINTMYDGFGNKTEMRCLDDDALLKCISLKTSANNQKQGIVFGKNGEIKRLPDNLLDKAMTADASSIASAVGIFAVSKETEMPEATTNEEIEAYNNPVPSPTATPEIPINESDAETTQSIEPSENQKTKSPEIK